MKTTDKISIYTQVPLDHELIDKRNSRWGLVHGSVRDVARRYGVDIEEVDGCIKLSAPKSRLQHIVEKLHFSEIPFSKTPF